MLVIGDGKSGKMSKRGVDEKMREKERRGAKVD
jgi:hypothetical protein